MKYYSIKQPKQKYLMKADILMENEAIVICKDLFFRAVNKKYIFGAM